MHEDPSADSLAKAFLVLHQALHDGDGREAALQRLVDLAVSTVPGCTSAAVTSVARRSGPRSDAATDDTARVADHLQYALGEGPCLTAAAQSSGMVELPDVGADDRWPLWCERVCTETTVRSVLSFHLGRGPRLAALNLYSQTSRAFDAAAVTTAALFASHAGALLAHAASKDKTDNLEIALGTSRLIGTAVGILMHALKITYDEAFARLTDSSSVLNRKVADVAEEVTRTGVLPGRP